MWKQWNSFRYSSWNYILVTSGTRELSIKCVQPKTCGLHVIEDSLECVAQQRSHKPTKNIKDAFEILLVTTPRWFLSINFKDDNIVSMSKVRCTYMGDNIVSMSKVRWTYRYWMSNVPHGLMRSNTSIDLSCWCTLGRLWGFFGRGGIEPLLGWGPWGCRSQVQFLFNSAFWI